MNNISDNNLFHKFILSCDDEISYLIQKYHSIDENAYIDAYYDEERCDMISVLDTQYSNILSIGTTHFLDNHQVLGSISNGGVGLHDDVKLLAYDTRSKKYLFKEELKDRKASDFAPLKSLSERYMNGKVSVITPSDLLNPTQDVKFNDLVFRRYPSNIQYGSVVLEFIKVYNKNVGSSNYNFYLAVDTKNNTYHVFYQCVSSNEQLPFMFKDKNLLKIGRYVNLLNTKNKWGISDKNIELFINKYKSFINTQKKLESFKIVSGEEIRYFYNEDQYISNKGTLGKSCMRYAKCKDFLDIYVKNPEVCSLLVQIEQDGKISGRALIWTLPDGRRYMDRIYYSYDFQVLQFKKWAQRNDIITKIISNINVAVKDDNIEQYPYMDTFKYISFGMLYNSKPMVGKYKLLDRTDGEYRI